MMLPYPLSLVVNSGLPRLLCIVCGAASLALTACSTNEAGTPIAPANYIEPHRAASGQQNSESDAGYEWFY
jgi:hypothetical protein